MDLRRAERTVYEKIYYMRKFFRKIPKYPEQISREEIRGYLKTLNCSDAVYKNVLGSLKVFFRDFMNRHEVVASFKFPRSPFKIKRIPSKEDLQRFYRALDSDMERALFLFYASTGLRRNEVLSLTAKDVDFEQRMVIPNCHNGTTKNSYVSFYNNETEEVLSKIEIGSGRVFPYSDRQYKKLWNRARERTDLRITPQRLREWFCCEMAVLGVNDRYIDCFCGRTPKSVLARHYTDYSPERLRRIYEEANLKVLA